MSMAMSGLNKRLEEPELQVEDRQSINTLTTRSRHSSAHGPYRASIPKGNAFPICNFVSSPFGSAESYSRSLLHSGNGYPIFDVVGDWDRSPLHIKRGPCIGDVGVLSHDGNFTLCFNIFSTSDDPVHVGETPPDFEALTLPDGSSEVTRVPDCFAPGTVIVSKGITVTHTADSPMNFTVHTSVREGGILVLPDGASREDYVPSPSLWKYIENNAASWYSHIYYNLRGSAQTLANGSLYLITGCDKTQSLSSVAIPIDPQSAGSDVELRYSGDNSAQPWSSNDTARIREISAEKHPGAWYAVFVRGIRIGLGHRAWASNLEVMPRNMRPYYNVLSTPIMGKWARIIRWFELRYGPRSASLPRWEVPLHVSDVILQVILNKLSNAAVVIVDDNTWIGQVDPVSGDGTSREISSLLVRVLLAHDIVETNRMAKLVLKTTEESSKGVLHRLSKGIRHAFDQWRAERAIKKVLNDR